MKTFSDGKYVYSVDMMLAYINEFKVPAVTYSLTILKDYPDFPVWTDDHGKFVTPNEAIKNPGRNKIQLERLKTCNLKYPIVINTFGSVMDGVHRVVKALRLKKKSLKAHVIDRDLLEKFKLGPAKNIETIVRQPTSDIIEKYVKTFHSK